MKTSPTPAEIGDLFDNQVPEVVWGKVSDIVRRINPAYDFTLVQSVYEDVLLRMFRGDYPGYCAIKTPYHDLPHTLGALLCGARLMHGAHISDDRLKDEEITMIMLSIILHDIGYAQRKGEAIGTGAQYTQTHVQRGIEFMRRYFSERKLPLDIAAISDMILGTEHPRPFAQIEFGSDRTLLLARIVATADIVGQMADRLYLEKLLFLYLEFREAQFGNYRSMYDLLCQTGPFYGTVHKKLDGALGGVYKKLEFHFRDTMGVGNNYYLQSIEKNMEHLSKVVAYDPAEFFAALRRKGIADSARVLA